MKIYLTQGGKRLNLRDGEMAAIVGLLILSILLAFWVGWVIGDVTAHTVQHIIDNAKRRDSERQQIPIVAILHKPEIEENESTEIH